MSLAGSQHKILLRLLAALRPHWREDVNLPSRIQGAFAANRSFGSRDRKLYRELIYTTLRYLPWIEPLLDSDFERAGKVIAWLAADLPATRGFREAWCGDWPACPATVAEKAAFLKMDAEALLPAWVARHRPEAALSPDLDALHTRAPLWLRLQGSPAAPVIEELAGLGWSATVSPVLTSAIEVRSEADVTRTRAWQEGRIEVQDLGSQMILASVGVPAGGRWLDVCAGAGGKTLQLAFLLGPTGRVEAHDIRASALAELRIRATRAGLNVSPAADSGAGTVPPRPAPTQSGAAIAIVAAPGGSYDGVLVDAPCSGSGTWRRSPHLKWTTGAGQVTQAAATQRQLLEQHCGFVRPGGWLVYATCSLSRFENEDVVSAFLASHPDFALAAPAQPFGFATTAAGLSISPARHNTDWFFVAALRRS